MKKYLLLISTILLPMAGFSQQSICMNDTIHFYQKNYRGKLTWQSSLNGTDWTPLPGTQHDTLTVIGETSAWYRTQVTEGICNPWYSEPIFVTVNAIPVVTLQLRDSVCVNEPDFPLTGGEPSDGTYSGDGIIDGRFIPNYAGVGTHRIGYRFVNLAGCGDSAYANITVLPAPNTADAGESLSNIPADSVRLDANVPVNATGTWSLVSGTYGHFSDLNDPKAWFIKDSSHFSYTLRWTLAGRCGSSHEDITLTFFPLSKNPCPGTPVVTDNDGNIYPTVLVGTQCWMAKNLNVGRYVESTVSGTEHANMSNNGIIEKYCLFNNQDSCKLYGGLYDWDEAMGYTTTEGARGICPQGWHIPTVAEWNALDALYTWGQAGLQIKVGGGSGWEGYYAGDRHPLGEFYSNGSSGFFWVSGGYAFEGMDDGYVREIAACNGLISTAHFSKKTGLSVRCIKDI